jgi:hypothetical protein
VDQPKTHQASLIDIVPAVRNLSPFDKLKLIRILAEELEKTGDIFPFEAGKTYYMATPYNMFGVADILSKTVYLSDKE